MQQKLKWKGSISLLSFKSQILDIKSETQEQEVNAQIQESSITIAWHNRIQTTDHIAFLVVYISHEMKVYEKFAQ